MEHFKVMYDSRVVIYEQKMFIRLATGVFMKCQNNTDSTRRTITKFVWQLGSRYAPSSPSNKDLHGYQFTSFCLLLMVRVLWSRTNLALRSRFSILIRSHSGQEVTTDSRYKSRSSSESSESSLKPGLELRFPVDEEAASGDPEYTEHILASIWISPILIYQYCFTNFVSPKFGLTILFHQNSF